MSPCRWPIPASCTGFIDPDAGDTLFVITAPPPIRGFIKRQDFVELSLLESIHGVAVHPNSDDVTAEIGTDKISTRQAGRADAVIGRRCRRARHRRCGRSSTSRNGSKNQEENFYERLDTLVKAAAAAGADQRTQARSTSPISTWRGRCIRKREGSRT